MITPELRKAASDVYAAAERLRLDAEAQVAPILERAGQIIDQVEALVGKPIGGRCESCGTIIVEGDTYAVDESAGLLICGEMQGAADGTPRCVDGQGDARDPEASHG